MSVVLGRFDLWEEKKDTSELIIVAHNVPERCIEWRMATDAKEAAPKSMSLSKISEIQLGHSLLKVGAVAGRCFSITSVGTPHLTLHLQTRTDSITRDDFIKSLLSIVPRSAVYTFDAPRAGSSGNDVIVKGSGRDLEEMRLSGTMYREELAAKTRVEAELRTTKANWDAYRTASEQKHQQRDAAFAAQKTHFENVIKILHEDLDVKKNEIRALGSRLELAKSMAVSSSAGGSVPPSPGSQLELNRLKELVETQKRKIQRLTEEKNKNAAAAGGFGASLLSATSSTITDFKAKEDEYLSRNKALNDRVSSLESELDSAIRERDQTARALSDAKNDLLSADQELREIRGLAARIEDQVRPRMARLEADRDQWEADRLVIKQLQEEKRAAWESASVAQLSAKVEQLAASLNRPRESFTARSGDLTADEIAILRRNVAISKKGPTEEKVGAMTSAPTDDTTNTTATAPTIVDSSEVAMLRVQLTKAQADLVEARGVAAKAEQLAIAVESNAHLAASVAEASDRVQRSEADLAALTERFHATVEDLKQKWQDAKRENLVLAEKYAVENKEKAACRAQLVQSRAELAAIQEQMEAAQLQERLKSEGATITELIEVKSKLNRSQTETEHVQRLVKELEAEVTRVTSELTRHQATLAGEREKWQVKHRGDAEKIMSLETLLAAARTSLLVEQQKSTEATRRADARDENVTQLQLSLREAETKRATDTMELARLRGEISRLELVSSGAGDVSKLLAQARNDVTQAQSLADQRYQEIQAKEAAIRLLEDDKRRLTSEIKTLLELNDKEKKDFIIQLAAERARSPSSAASITATQATTTVTVVDTAAIESARRDADIQQNEVTRLNNQLRDVQLQLDTSRNELSEANRQLKNANEEVARLKGEISSLDQQVRRETVRAVAAESQLAQSGDSSSQLALVNKQLIESQEEAARLQLQMERYETALGKEKTRGNDGDALIASLRQQLAAANAAVTSANQAAAVAQAQALVAQQQPIIAVSVAPTPSVSAPASPAPPPSSVSSASLLSTPPMSGALHVRAASSALGDVSSPLIFPASPASITTNKTTQSFKIELAARSLPGSSTLSALVTLVGKSARGSYTDFMGSTETITNPDGDIIKWKKVLTIGAGLIDDFKLSVYNGNVEESKRQGSALFTSATLTASDAAEIVLPLSHSTSTIDATLKAAGAHIIITRIAA